MTTKLLKVIDKKIIELDGVKVEVELRMIENCWKKVVFVPHARFNHTATYPTQLLKKKYAKFIKKTEKENINGNR